MPLLFQTPTLADREAVCAAAEVSHAAENDASFVNLYLLREKYGTEFCFSDGMLLRRYSSGFRAGGYGFPLGGGDLKSAVALLRQDAESRGIPFRMTLLTRAQCGALEAAFPACFSITQAADYTEYLYLRENLAEMRGSRYHGKRNHIAQFRRGYPDSYIQPLIAENAHYAVEIAEQWLANREHSEDAALQYELSCIKEAAENWSALGLGGLLLYAEEQPVGMTVVSQISSGIYDVHFEKVIPNQPHAWPVVANEMARCLADARYLNREEDLGEGGMRASKQSYRPDLLNEKFIAKWKGV